MAMEALKAAALTNLLKKHFSDCSPDAKEFHDILLCSLDVVAAEHEEFFKQALGHQPSSAKQNLPAACTAGCMERVARYLSLQISWCRLKGTAGTSQSSSSQERRWHPQPKGLLGPM